MSIYLVSNRKVADNRFSNKGKEKAQRDFRVAKVNIPNGNNPVEYEILQDNNFDGYREVIDMMDDNSDITMAQLPGTAYMFYDLYHQMLEVKDKQSDCLFFIHGFANKLEDNLEHIKKLHEVYIAPPDSGIDHLVYLAWPSIGHKVLTYWNDQEDAEETGKVLGRMFNKLRGFFIELFEFTDHKRCSNRIHLAAHSQGNTVLEYMMRTIVDHKLFQLFGEVLLLHSDVSWEVFEPGQPFTKLPEVSSRIHMYISQSDEVLGVISNVTKNQKRRLGHRGPKNRDVLDNETYIVNTTKAGRAETLRERTLDHWGYIERPTVINDIIQVLAGKEMNLIKGRTPKSSEKNYFYLK